MDRPNIIDIKTSVLYGKLGDNDKLFMGQPAGYEAPGKEIYVSKLQASQYLRLPARGILREESTPTATC
jgi:hypothetical protein